MLDHIDFEVEHEGAVYKIDVTPDETSVINGMPFKFSMWMDEDRKAYRLERTGEGWKASADIPQALTDKIGSYVLKCYE